MDTVKIKFIVTFFMILWGFFYISILTGFFTPIYQNPSLILRTNNLFTAVFFLGFLSVWVYTLLKILESTYFELKFGSPRDQELKHYDKELHSIDIFLDVAQKEYLKRNISKKTFEDIQRIAGKKMVEIKAKRKETASGDAKEAKGGERG